MRLFQVIFVDSRE